jgi:hypothetical protein
MVKDGFVQKQKQFLMVGESLSNKGYVPKTATQQSVHPTLGILARFQAFFYALSFFQSDGVPPPAPARVTPAVRRVPSHQKRNAK